MKGSVAHFSIKTLTFRKKTEPPHPLSPSLLTLVVVSPLPSAAVWSIYAPS